jgi:hypothetical protein
MYVIQAESPSFFDLEGTIIEDASDPAAATKGIIISPYLMPGYHI